MKLLKQTIWLCLTALVTMSFSQCASVVKLEDVVHLELGEVYQQSWVAGVQGGGSGYNLYVPVKSNPKKIVLDSLFFKGKWVKLELKSASLYVGHFKTKANQRHDVIMSSDPVAEYGNPVPNISTPQSMKLNDSECLVSYKKGKKTLYFKISNVTKKSSYKYPKTPPKS